MIVAEGPPRVMPNEGSLPDTIYARPQTRVMASLLDCVNGRRGWDSPLEGEIEADTAVILKPRNPTPLTDRQYLILHATTHGHLMRAAENTRAFARWICGEKGRKAAIEALTDVRAFREAAGDYVKGGHSSVSAGEGGNYWMWESVREKVGELYSPDRPVTVWDWGGATGIQLLKAVGDCRDRVSAHITDLEYIPHDDVDGVHRYIPEILPSGLSGSIDISTAIDLSTAVFSLRYSTLPHLAVRNILGATRHAAYLTVENYAAATSIPNRHEIFKPYLDEVSTEPISDAWLESHQRILLRTDSEGKPTPESIVVFGLLERILDRRVRDELTKASEDGWDIRVKPQRRPEYMKVGDMGMRDFVERIVAKKENNEFL
jgi:hypothetical protein